MGDLTDRVQVFLDQVGERVAFLEDCHSALAQNEARVVDALRVDLLLANVYVTLAMLATRLAAVRVDGFVLDASELAIPRVRGEWVRPAGMVEYHVEGEE